MSCYHSRLKLQTQAKVFCFYGEKKLSFREYTVTVYSVYTTGILAKIYLWR